ncbi:hypothetical protein ABZT43_46820, partial [Streptomyces sp. NPDC005349]|uniref:hypothetical protein n=1 Tax=Streptomyces sp. NPDC005349 TaxID=3157037 RepID=UPI0033A2C261
ADQKLSPDEAAKKWIDEHESTWPRGSAPGAGGCFGGPERGGTTSLFLLLRLCPKPLLLRTTGWETAG